MSDLVKRARFLASGQDDPHSATITELCDHIESLREALLWCSRHAGGEIADDASLAELKYVPEVVRLRIEAFEREVVAVERARDFYAGRYAERCGDVLAEQGWQPIETLKPQFGEVLGYAPGCGYEVVRCHSDGTKYAGAFTADWVKSWRPLPPPPIGGQG